MTDSSKNQLAHLGFVRIDPSVSLHAYIDSYWFIDATCTESHGFHESLHPDGGMGFIFNYGDGFQINNNKQINTFLDGTNTKSTCLTLTENINALGIRFKPAGAAAFFDMPLDELKNQNIDLVDLNFNLYSQLYHQLPEQENLLAKISLIEKTLLKTRKPEGKVSVHTYQAIQQIKQSHGRCSIKRLSQELEINQRKLERLFKSQLGMSAIEYAKTVRAKQARTILKETDLPLAEMAYKLGYFDQAHFTRSFKSVVGITPGQYRIDSKSKRLRPSSGSGLAMQ